MDTFSRFDCVSNARVKSSTRASRCNFLFLCILFFPCLHPFAFGASLYTETFTDSASGWAGVALNPMTVTNSMLGNPGGSLQGSFSATPFPPLNGSFVATGHLASANFIGDYTEAGAWLLGFDFMAEHIVPSDLRVEIYSSSNFIYRIVYQLNFQDVAWETGVWYSIRIPLLSAATGGWLEDIDQFNTIMTNVSRLEIVVFRQTAMAQTYYVDNIFLDRLPIAVHMTESNLEWSHFRNGEDYRFQASSDITSPNWFDLGSFTATGSVYNVAISATNAWQYYRMLME